MTTTLETILPQIANIAKLFANGDIHEADDIASEACAYILKHGYENESPAYILQSVKWVAFGHIDSARSYEKYVASIEGTTATDDDDELDALELTPDSAASPEDLIADREFAEAFSEAVATLDPKAQVIIRLLNDGNSFAEIANAMGVSRSAISQRMNTIQMALAAALMM
jgi:RNA polymerase sigma factor (sigma-70 family)